MAITTTTALQAVNTMLQTIGESAVTDLADPAYEVAAAVTVLDEVVRDVCLDSYVFNTEEDVELVPDAVGVTAQGMVHVAGIPSDADEFTVATTSGVPWRFQLTANPAWETGDIQGANTSFISLLDSSDELLTTEYLVAQAITTGINHSAAAAAGVTARQVVQGAASTTPPYSYNAWEVGIISLDEYPTNHPDYVVDSSEITPYDQSALHGKNILLTQDAIGESGNGLVVNAERLIPAPNAQLNTFNFGENGMRVGVDAGYIDTNNGANPYIQVRNQSSGEDYVIRGGYLYSMKNRSSVFTDTVTATVVYLLDFLELPEAAKRYCVIRAARTFADRMVGSKDIRAFSERDEMEAKAKLADYEFGVDKINMLGGSSTVAFSLVRRS